MKESENSEDSSGEGGEGPGLDGDVAAGTGRSDVMEKSVSAATSPPME